MAVKTRAKRPSETRTKTKPKVRAKPKKSAPKKVAPRKTAPKKTAPKKKVASKKKVSAPTPVSAYARLNARVMPVDRGERYEDPLSEVLEKEGVAEVTGGGTMQASNGEIEYCGIDLVLHDVDRAVPIVCEVLSELGAPKGSALEYSIGKKRVSVPFGILEGLAIYLNGTDLPKEVYETSDINAIYADIERLLGERGEIQGHWQGPTETALYLYGYSVTEMKKLLAAYMAKTPLCARARLVKIA